MATFKHTPRTYMEARETFRDHARTPRGGGALRALLGPNTYLHARGNIVRGDDGRATGWDAYAVRLHDTDVVTFYRNGVVALSTGGWYSPTTANRMHAFTPASVCINIRRAGNDPRMVVSVADGRQLVETGWGESFYQLTFRELVTERDGGTVYLMPVRTSGVDTYDIATERQVRAAIGRAGLVTVR